MGVKAFIFDCGGVLLHDGDLSAYRMWEECLGMQPGELAPKLWQGETWMLAERGQLSDTDFWRRAGAQIGLQDADQAARLREDLWSTWVVNAKVLTLIERAHATCKVGLLSNATDALEDLLEHRYRVADRFDVIVNSARLGLAKPDKGIYEETLRRLDVAPHEAVFIDDRAENVAAAAALGMHVIWFINADELERQLNVYLNHNGEDGK
jgi:putative hydrolase of the HAD superfamily